VPSQRGTVRAESVDVMNSRCMFLRISLRARARVALCQALAPDNV
jgi:hypothetical protein